MTHTNDFSEEKMSELKKYPLSYRLRRIRWWNNLSQCKFAEKIGCSQSTVSMWEHGRTIPDDKWCEKMAELFHLPEDFFTEEEIENI